MKREATHPSAIRSIIRDPAIRWTRRMMIGLVLISLFADFIANDRPLYCRTSAGNDFPAFRAALSKAGLGTWTIADAARDWHAEHYLAVIFAPVPYRASSTDLHNANFRGPFDPQEVRSMRFRHWLGTDQLGRDVLAGLISGTRIALLVGLVSMLLAAMIGIPIGAAVGYLGDDRLRLPAPVILTGLIGTCLILYFIIVFIESTGQSASLSLIVMAILVIVMIAVISWMLKKRKWHKRWKIPADTLTLRAIEILRSIPGFFLLFAVLGMVRTPRLVYVILLIALLYTPSVIRYIRAEALKLRRETYIQSAEVLGLSARQMIFRHVIPNAIGPVMITLAFGTGAAVLVESGLSFLGIGVAPEVVTWGKMLNSARANFSAWWLALLPGIAIFLTIAMFNRVGDYLEVYLSGREQR